MAELTPDRLEEIRERKDRAFDMVLALCKPRGTEGRREWIMSIPARPDHDPDLVIGAALKDIDALLAHIDAQAEEIDIYKGQYRRAVEAQREAFEPLAEELGINWGDSFLLHAPGLVMEYIKRLRRVVEDAQSAPQRAQEWMRANGVQVADPSVPMQRAVFEVYNLLVELAQQAEAALDGGQDGGGK